MPDVSELTTERLLLCLAEDERISDEEFNTWSYGARVEHLNMMEAIDRELDIRARDRVVEQFGVTKRAGMAMLDWSV